MNDSDRIYPVSYFFLHHSTGADFVNADDITVQDWYSDTGKGRAYSNGAINPHHEHPSRPGVLSYAQAQFTLREYTKDGNKYGWRLTDLIQRPWQNVTWSVGNWDYNQRSCSVEICGNYLGKVLPDKALMLIADFLRPIDAELNGALRVWLHKEVYATACPARIAEQRDTIVDMINNPDKWNAILWPVAPPAPKPQPVTTTEDVTIKEAIPFTKRTGTDSVLPLGEKKVTQVGVDGFKSTTYTVTKVNGIETGRVIKSTSTKAPVDEITAVGTYIKPTIDPIENETASGWLKRAFAWVMEILSKFTFKK